MKRYTRFLFIVFLVGVLAWMPAVEAASKITLTSGKPAPVTVYTGHTYELKVAGTSVRYYSDNKDVATVGLNSGKLTPKQPGEVTIRAKNAKSGKTVASKKFTVLMRADSVALDRDLIELSVKGTHTLKPVLSPANATDVLKFKSSDKRVATVGLTSGKITAQAEGEAVITVYALPTKSSGMNGKAVRTTTVRVRVAPEDKLVGVVQSTDYEYKATFGKDVAELALDALRVSRQSDGADIPVKAVKKKSGRTAVFVLDEPLENDVFLFAYKGTVIPVRSRFLRADALAVTPQAIEQNVGERVPLAAVLTPEDSTDVVRYVSENPAVASVELKTGLVRCLTPGQTAIVAYALKKDGAKTTPEGNAVIRVPVTVTSRDAIASAEQLAPKKLRLGFLMDASALKASDLTLTKADGSDAGVRVTSLENVKGEPFTRMAVLSDALLNGARYEVRYKDSAAGFTALEMSISKVSVLPAFVAPGFATRLFARAYDKDGNVLYSTKDYLTLSADSLPEGAQFTGGLLTLKKAGDEAGFLVTTDFTKAVQSKDFTEDGVVRCKELGTYCFCEALYPAHRMDDGKIHDPAGCRVPDHFLCDGRQHAASGCGVQGHFDCDGADHDAAPCAVRGHFNCDGANHGKCAFCGQRLCNGQTHGDGICNYVPPQPVPTPSTTPPTTPTP